MGLGGTRAEAERTMNKYEVIDIVGEGKSF